MKNGSITFPLGFLALLACAWILPSSPVKGAIVNGDFELGAAQNNAGVWEAPMTPWTIQSDAFNNVIGVDTAVQYALAPHSANIAAAFYSDTGETGAGASLTQSIITVPLLTYDVSLWVANPIQDTGNLNNVFSISWNGQVVSLSNTNLTETAAGSKMYVVTPSTPWFQLVVPNLPVTGASTDLKIIARNNDWATLVDDVIVEQTPEPSSLVMLCAGAALLGARRRRQQRAS